MLDAVAVGETLALMNPLESGSLKYVDRFSKQLGGSESNFAIGLARLGHSVGWISRLGSDSLGDYIESFVRGEGVDVSQVIRDPGAPTGLMIKERWEMGTTEVHYYRRGSAASRMSPGDIPEAYLKQARYLHLTGITPALSESCRQAVYHSLELARKHGLTVTFDPNLRLKLWDKGEMTRVILDLISRADVVLPGLAEGMALLNTQEPEEIADQLLALGPRVIVLKLGSRGALLATQERKILVKGFPVQRVVDPVGAGDGFAAGFVSGRLRGLGLEESVRLGNAVGAFAITVRGDVEGLPTWDQLMIFLGEKDRVER